MSALDQDIAACAGIVQKGDPDRFLAIMSGPVALREKLFPLYAFNVEVARAPWVTQESMIAEMRLQWWRDALEEIANGSEVRRHEVVTPLARVLSPDQARLLDDLVLARRWDIYKDPFEDAAHFDKHLQETAGALLQVAAEQAGGAQSAAYARIGAADGLARWFLAIPQLEQHGRIPLVDGRAETVANLAEKALLSFKSARREIGKVDANIAAALRLSWQAVPILKRVTNQPDLVVRAGLDQGEFSKKFSLLWRSLRSNW